MSHSPASASPAGAPPRTHLVQLDALRAIAVLGVLLSHFMYRYEAFAPAGSLGVRLFFVLSGFLITGILLDSRDALARGAQGLGFTLRQFYIRRFLRIFPLFYATLLVAWVCDVPEVRASIGWHVTYLSNVYFALTDAWHPPVSHLWSLAVEEQFYLVWPFLVLLAPARLLVPAIVVAIGMAPAFRWIGAEAGVREMVLHNMPISALDSLGVGALLAVLPAARPGLLGVAQRRGFAWGTIALLLLVLALHVPRLAAQLPLRWIRETRLVETVASLAFACVILGAARGWRGPMGRLLAWSPLTYVGRISYGVYVLHNFMAHAVPWLFRHLHLPYPANDGWERLLLLTAATLVAAACSWHFFEKPINDLKRRFPYRRDDRRPGAPAPRLVDAA